MKTQREKLHELLASFDIAVLTTHGGTSHFRSRPMAIARVDENCDLWFIAGRDSAKVHEIGKNTRVQVVCQNGWRSCVCVAGRASLNDDPSKIRELWSQHVWFPLAPDDPRIVLIHVVVEWGEYWDNTSINRLTYVYQSIKAMVMGTNPAIRGVDEHGEIYLADRAFTVPNRSSYGSVGKEN